MQDRPSSGNALETVRDFLEDLLPTLEGDARFKTRVSIHLLEIVARELELGPRFDAREREGLAALLGDEDPGELSAGNRLLAAKIRAEDFEGRHDEVFDHVLQSVEDKLRIVNPRRLS